MSEIAALLNQFTTRYRTAVLTKVGLWLALGFGVIATLVWRLRVLGVPALWSVGAPALAALVLVGAAWWWAHRRWISPQAAAAHLDRVLGLQERLTTAEEFAHTEQIPALYPLLVDDVSQSFSAARAQLPKTVDRTTAVLAVALLLLLLLPFRGKAPIQLAGFMPHQPAPPPPVPPETMPLAPPSSQQQQPSSSTSPSQSSSRGQGGESQSSSGNASSQPQGGQSQSPQQAGQSGSSSAEREGGSAQPQSGESSASSQGTPHDGQQRAPSGEAQSGGTGQSKEQAASGAQGQPRDAQHTASQGGATQQSQPTSGSGSQAAPSQAQQQAASAQQASSGTSNVSGKSTTGQGAAQQASNAATPQQQSGSGSPGASGSAGAQQAPSGSGTSPGSQEIMKGQIQGLLKELSGELKNLEAQLASAKNEAQPQAGTTTDPQLYGSSDPMSQRGNAPVPISLQADTAPTTSQRPSSGVAQPSGRVSASGPQVTREDAALAQEPAQEHAVTRQVVPPEYRSVFDKLHQQQSAQPSEQTP